MWEFTSSEQTLDTRKLLESTESCWMDNAASSIEYYINIFIQMAGLGTLFLLIDGSFGVIIIILYLRCDGMA